MYERVKTAMLDPKDSTEAAIAGFHACTCVLLAKRPINASWKTARTVMTAWGADYKLQSVWERQSSTHQLDIFECITLDLGTNTTEGLESQGSKTKEQHRRHDGEKVGLESESKVEALSTTLNRRPECTVSGWRADSRTHCL